MPMVTRAKFHFHELMVTLILACGPVSMRQAWQGTQKAGQIGLKLKLGNFSPIATW